jgi:hypothetical protein
VTRPQYKYFSIQRRLRRLLENLTTEGVVDTEFAFRASPEHEISVADVALPNESGSSIRKVIWKARRIL